MPFKNNFNFSWIYNIEIYNRLEEKFFFFAIIKIDNYLLLRDLYK